jgi:hypothetical protein
VTRWRLNLTARLRPEGRVLRSESETFVMRTSRIYALPAAALLLTGLAGPAVAEVVDGTKGPDVLYGTAGADTIRGYKGADTLLARAGDDTLHGGLGADRIYGRRGADRILPGDDARKDVLHGGPGPDRIDARTVDVVYAEDGNDTVRVLEVVPWAAYPEVHCGPGVDTLVLPYGVDYGPHLDCEHVRSAQSPFD